MSTLIKSPIALNKQEEEQLNSLALNLGVAQSLISRNYLTKLDSAQIIPLDGTEKNVLPQQKLRLFRITAISYDKLESITEKLNSLFCALSLIQDCNLVMLIHNHIENNIETLELYLGVSGNYVEQMTEASKILEHSICGNFPGCELQPCFADDIEKLMPTVIYQNAEATCAISSVSVDAVKRSADENFIQGMEKFADGMRGTPYTLMLIASPVASTGLVESLNAYRELYTQLSPYRMTTTTLNETYGEGKSITVGTQISQTLSRTKSFNRSFGITNTVGGNKSVSSQKTDITGSLIEVGATLLGIAGGITLGAPALALLGFGYGGKFVGSKIREFTGNESKNEMTGTQVSKSHNQNQSEGDQFQQGIQTGENQSISDNQNHNIGFSMQRSVENKHVADVLNSLDRQIHKMSASLGQRAYNVAAYVIASDKITAETGASLYCSLLSGNQADSVAAINTWDKAEEVELMQEYLIRARHPTLRLLKSGALDGIDATTFVPCSEMPLHFFLPRKSLAGLQVSRHAEFARSIPCDFDVNEPHVRLGSVYHFGKVENNIIALTTESLCSHTCLVGTPGSGKSNAAYQMLVQLMDLGVHFMVVEPAKGEYSQVLGGYPSVQYLSTRFSDGQLFSINPFAFPRGTSALEHAESLLSILTTCWSMYAAMTDILKDAVIQIYEDAGWNMSEIGEPWDEDYHFPTFNDLMKVLPDLIQQSDYSNEVKGNYKGSLLTRVKSMVNGLNKKIFGCDCLSDEDLFNQNVIIDLSSIGSSENRALIMGVLIIRLNEFRQSKKKAMNRSLQHVTLLEEAHNILSAGTDGGVSSKAVELFNRAIAEMRSQGEGFIIVDQTPSRLDSSVIANTTNKIVFTLQHAEDILSMGKAMSLTPEQTEDIAVLPRGACIVRSRNWLAPVRVKVPLFDKSLYKPYRKSSSAIDLKDMRIVRGKMLTALLRSESDQATTLSKELSRNEEKDRLLLDAFDVLQSEKKLSAPYRIELYRAFFDTANWLRLPNKDTIIAWDRNARKHLKHRARLEIIDQDRIIQSLLFSIVKPESRHIADAWLELAKSQ